MDIRRLPWIRRLAADYAYAFDRLEHFFAGNPHNPQHWAPRIAGTQAHARPRDAVADILARQQSARGAPPAARQAAERLRDPRTVAVLSGQQAGVAGGPLFTLLKALTAIRLARTIEAQHKTPAVPVFWIDAEDHDWDEVAAVTVLDAEYQVRTLTLPAPARANQVPVATIQLDETVLPFLADLKAAMPPTEFTDALLERLSAAYRPGAGMVDAFGRWLETVLGPHGLIVYDCSDASAKPLLSHVFAHELAHPGRTSQLAADAGAALERQGYHAQVTASSDGVALFHLNGGRQPIRRDGSYFLPGDTRVPAAEMVLIAEREPHRFSPNVLLRPIVQDTLFPTVAYIAGPNELAYLAQLKGIYAHFGIPMPLMVPRPTATVLDSAAVRFMTKYDVAYDSLQPQDEAGLNRLLQSQLPPQVEASLQDAQHTVTQRMAAVIAAVRSLDPTLEGAARSSLGRMEHELQALQTKVIHAAKKRDDTLRRQFARTRTQAFPNGQPQERTLGFVWFLNRYGPALVDILERDLPHDGTVHAVLTP
jgi:bacillithiol biosynthesis cysteine-adding enzyme BshC